MVTTMKLKPFISFCKVQNYAIQLLNRASLSVVHFILIFPEYIYASENYTTLGKAEQPEGSYYLLPCLKRLTYFRIQYCGYAENILQRHA